MNICVTGCCGFIGFHLSKLLIKKKINIFGLDTINNYYDINIKKNRLRILNKYKNFNFKKIDISNYRKLDNLTVSLFSFQMPLRRGTTFDFRTLNSSIIFVG